MASEKEKMLAGERYDAMDPELVEERLHAAERTRAFNRMAIEEWEAREEILADLLGSTGEDFFVTPPFRCDYGYNVHVGDRFYANTNCVILDVCRVDFGDHCMLGPGTHVYTATHPLDPAERRTGAEYGKPVSVGDDVWIGGQAVINPGVTIGDGAVVASGAVVMEDVPPGVVVQGNPAEVTRTIETD